MKLNVIIILLLVVAVIVAFFSHHLRLLVYLIPVLFIFAAIKVVSSNAQASGEDDSKSDPANRRPGVKD